MYFPSTLILLKVLCCSSKTSILNTTIAIIKLLIASALVNTLTTGRTSYTKALLPMAPNIPPTAKLILESKSLSGIRKTKQDIKNDNKPPVKILKNRTRPPLLLLIQI